MSNCVYRVSWSSNDYTDGSLGTFIYRNGPNCCRKGLRITPSGVILNTGQGGSLIYAINLSCGCRSGDATHFNVDAACGPPEDRSFLTNYQSQPYVLVFNINTKEVGLWNDIGDFSSDWLDFYTGDFQTGNGVTLKLILKCPCRPRLISTSNSTNLTNS